MHYINARSAKCISYYCVYCLMVFQSYLFSLSIHRPRIEKFLYYWMNHNVIIRFNLNWWICEKGRYNDRFRIISFLFLWLNGIIRISLFIIKILSKIWNSLNEILHIFGSDQLSNCFHQRKRIKKKHNKSCKTILANTSTC